MKRSKHNRGISIRSLEEMNKASLMKLGWNR